MKCDIWHFQMTRRLERVLVYFESPFLLFTYAKNGTTNIKNGPHSVIVRIAVSE